MTEGDRPLNPEYMERTLNRFRSRVIEGISAAHAEGREIDAGTARLIAHILGRALGRDSALAEFGRTNEGSYELLRDEYLMLYNEVGTPPMIKEWIDWLGTHLIQAQADGSGRRYQNEQLAPSLERVLVKTPVEIAGELLSVHLPANLDAAAISRVAIDLGRLNLAEGRAFVAFLTLPDVDASSPRLLSTFIDTYHANFANVAEAVEVMCELEDWRSAVDEVCERFPGVLPGAVSLDLQVVERHLRDAWDVVELDGRAFIFTR